jgi:hypothetical protein
VTCFFKLSSRRSQKFSSHFTELHSVAIYGCILGTFASFMCGFDTDILSETSTDF